MYNNKLKKKKINFAIIGCGHIGTRHAEHIKKNKNSALAATCDIEIKRAKKNAKKYGAKIAVQNYKDLFDCKDIDVVNICVPNGLHAKITIDFLKHGKHVVCEKPMCLLEKEGKQMIYWAHKKNKHLFIIKQNRYNPPVEAIKQAIDKGALGKIYHCSANLYWNRNKKYYDQSDWRGTKKMDGGTLFTQFSHFLDLVLWLVGDVKIVRAITANISHPYTEFEDTGGVLLNFKNGALGTINFTTAVYRNNMEGSIYILGTKGSAKIGGQYINTLDFWDVQRLKRPNIAQSAPANDYGFYKGSMSNHDKVIQNVINVLRGEGKIKATAEEGLKTVQLICAIYKSANTNKVITL